MSFIGSSLTDSENRRKEAVEKSYSSLKDSGGVHELRSSATRNDNFVRRSSLQKDNSWIRNSNDHVFKGPVTGAHQEPLVARNINNKSINNGVNKKAPLDDGANPKVDPQWKSNSSCTQESSSESKKDEQSEENEAFEIDIALGSRVDKQDESGSKSNKHSDEIKIVNQSSYVANGSIPNENDTVKSNNKIQSIHTDDNELLERGLLRNIFDREKRQSMQEGDKRYAADPIDPKDQVSTNAKREASQNDTAKSNEASGERFLQASVHFMKEESPSKQWTRFIVICAISLLIGLIIGIIVLSQRGMQTLSSSSESPSNHEFSSNPSMTPSLTQIETNEFSNIPSSSVSNTFSPSVFRTQISTLLPPSATVTLSPSASLTQLPTSSPSSLPSATVTLSPSVSPTQLPTSSPSNQPSMSSTLTPTVPPTISKVLIESSINDECTNAIGPLASDFSLNVGTIANAGTEFVDQCGYIKETGPGVWYFTIGTGGEMMAHTCSNTNFDSKITIFEGGCDKPLCREANDDFCGPDGSQSAVSWSSRYGSIYYILVASVSDFEDGSFDIVIGARSNHECNTAIGPLTVEDPMPVLGSTTSATVDDVFCGDVKNESSSVWYLVRGTGGKMKVDLCEETNFSVRIRILTGSCSELNCFTVSSVGNCSVTWYSDLSVNYYVLISGDRSRDDGSFSLKLSTI